jgi:FkbM family methyltransferase
MEKDNAYYPSIWRVRKFSRYISYFWQYLKWGDFNSLGAALKYTLFHTPSKKGWVSKSEMGTFHIRPNTSDFQFINVAYESAIKVYLKGLIPKMTYFVDVGACIGEYNVWLAKSGVKCFAFEPVNFVGLRENVKLNQLENLITVYPIGIGAKKEKVTFEVMKTVTGSSNIDRSKGEGNIEIDTLDSVFEKFSVKDNETLVMKMDVEGMEGEVIDGGMNFLAGIKNLYVIYERFADSEDVIERRLNKIGKFEYSKIDSANYVGKRIS